MAAGRLHALARRFRRPVRIVRSALEGVVDRAMGIEASEAAVAGSISREIEGAALHRPSAWFGTWRTFRAELDDATGAFLDLGCGAGRSLIIAARFPVTRVIGVELDPAVAALARHNVAGARGAGARPVEIVEADVTAYAVPDDVGAVYLFNPFFGDVMERAMRQVIASYDRRPRRLRIIYAFPSDERTLLATGRISVLRTHRRRRPLARWERMLSTTVYEVGPAPE
jgi:SAM-dependent methyltransferase